MNYCESQRLLHQASSQTNVHERTVFETDDSFSQRIKYMGQSILRPMGSDGFPLAPMKDKMDLLSLSRKACSYICVQRAVAKELFIHP